MPAPKKSAAASSNFTAVVGTDEARVKEAALALSRELAPADAGDFGVEVIDGVAENAEHCERIVRSVMEALQTLPFFGGGKLVWLKNANFLADTQVGKTIAALEGAESILDYVEKQSAVRGEVPPQRHGGGQAPVRLQAHPEAGRPARVRQAGHQQDRAGRTRSCRWCNAGRARWD